MFIMTHLLPLNEQFHTTTNNRIIAFILPKWHNICSTADISYFSQLLYIITQYKVTLLGFYSGQVQFLLEKDFFCKISLPVFINFF